MQAAADLLDDLRVDQEQPVDVFGVIEQLGMWLVFQPFQALLGAVVPQGSGGVMITTEREPAIQRYTAAHEIGHWHLDQNQSAFDTETDIFNPNGNEREYVAQWFASYFLMPPPLVYAAVARHLPRGKAMSPGTAYLVARDMRVSYEAALRQMANLDIVSGHTRDQLLTVPRMRAKQEAAYGRRPTDGYADVWVADERSLQPTSQQQFDVVVHDEIVVALPENRTTGYQWLDETGNARRASLHAYPAPAPFGQPETPSAALPDFANRDTEQRTTAEVNAALALLAQKARSLQGALSEPSTVDTTFPDQSRDGLRTVVDEYRPGWARLTSRNRGKLREAIAGKPSDSTQFLAPAPSEAAPTQSQLPARQPDPANPGVGATGLRLLVFQANVEGRFTQLLHYAPVHDPHTPPAMTFTIAASVSPPPAVRHRQALLNISLDDPTDESSRTDDETNP
jgi:Zn-dependent peptidase ImmA (M78 family)